MDQVGTTGTAASEPSSDASISPGGSDPFGIGIEQAGTETATEAPESVEPEMDVPETAPAPEDDIDPKYRGKSPAEIARMHQEAEKAMHLKSQEAAELRKYNETMQALVQQLQQQQAPIQQAPPQQQPRRYFHELPPEHQEEMAKWAAQEFGSDPLDAVYKLAVNQPYTIDQHLKGSQVLKDLMRQEMQQHFNSAFEDRRTYEQQFANHAKTFIDAHPDFKEHENDMAGFMNFAQQTGFLGQMIQAKIDPFDFAYNYVKGYKSNQLQQAAADAAKQSAEAQQKERQSGFQLGQKSTPKPAQVYDPFNIYGQ